MVAAEALADAHARRGRAADDVALLEELAARDPLRESVAVRLVRALYVGAGRPTRWPPTSGAAGHWRTSWASSPRPRCAGCTPPCSPRSRCPAPPAPSCRRNLPPRNRSFVGRTGCSRRRRDAGRRHAPAAGGRAHRAGRGREDRAGAGAGAPAAPRGARRLVDLRRGPGRHRHRARRAGRGARHRRVRAGRGHAGGAVGRAGPHAGVAAGLRQRGRAAPARAVPAGRPPRRHRHHLTQPGLAPAGPPRRRRAADPPRGSHLRRRPDRGPPATADALAELLGDLPLALEQACAYIEQTGMSVPDYVDLFRRRRDRLLLRDADGSGRTVATTWGLAFDRLAGRSPRAAALLETIAFLAPDAIEIATLRRFEPDELELPDALAELLRLSLVDREADTVRVHRLVQDVVRARMTAGRAARPARRGGGDLRRPGRRGRRGRRPRRPPGRARRPRRGARRRPGRPRRGAEPRGRRAGAAGAVPGCRARAARRAAAAGRRRRPGRPWPADLPARRGARCGRAAGAGPGAAPGGGRAAGGRGRGRRRRARPRPPPARPRAQLRRRGPGGHRGAPAGPGGLPPARSRRSRARGADRPRLHVLGRRAPRRRGGEPAVGAGAAGGPGAPRRARLGARHRGAGHGRAGCGTPG